MSEVDSIIHTEDLDYYVDRYALTQALEAVSENSYGVGGIMVNLKDKNIIKVMHNTVIACENDGGNYRLKDPTAHGERQLVDWYFANRLAQKLPAPEDILIITTLDPCCMCTGSLLSAGFRVIVVALDNLAGINWDYKHQFSPFRGKELERIKSSFIYPAQNTVPGRPGFGSVPLFNSKTLKADTIEKCLKAFNDGANKARALIKDIVELKDARDPALSGLPVAYLDILRTAYPRALTYRANQPGVPDERLANYLIEAAKEDKTKGGDGDAVAFLDCFGNLLMCKGGAKSLSPIRTAYMETIRAYQAIRYQLTQHDKDALRYFCEPKFGTFVFVKGFDKGTQSFADLGAYGSTILGDFNNPTNLQYITPRIPHTELQSFISGMPPRYRTLIHPQRVSNQRLIVAVEQG